MITPRHANPDPGLQRVELIPMMAVAASKAASPLDPAIERVCKRRANCLKPKEVRKLGASRSVKHFDLRRSLNYLKVKTIGRRPTGSRPATPVSVLRGFRQV
jgi:hypothetical protein